MSDIFKLIASNAVTGPGNRNRDLLPLLRPETRGHLVQFYKDDAFLIENVTHLVEKTLSAGDSSVLVATSSHIGSIEERLTRRGLDLRGLRAEGRYVALDANETLSRLMLNDWPNDDRFIQIIEDVIRRAIEKSATRFVFAFGEMVALLCAADKPNAALCLEQLWNSLIKRYCFSLCCGYPLSSLVSESALDAVLDICVEHSFTIPAEADF